MKTCEINITHIENDCDGDNAAIAVEKKSDKEQKETNLN